MELNKTNYYSSEANKAFMSSTQFKDFIKCEESALAKINEEYEENATIAMLVGSYVDAYFDGSLNKFKAVHPEIFKKDGNLKSDYIKAEYMIHRAERDELFMKYLSGQKQVVMTGEIASVPFKIRIDSFHPGKAIVDLKTVKDFKPVYDEANHSYKNFVEHWGYDIQGAIYQEIVRQTTGVALPFFIAAITKEEEPDLCLMNIPQERLDQCLDFVKTFAPRFQAIKQRTDNPQRCGKCNWCKKTKVLNSIIDYRDLEV